MITEILFHHHKATHYRHIVHLFFQPVAAFHGILNVSLERLSPWKSSDECQNLAVSAVLQLIRVRARADEKSFSKTPEPPPTSDDEKEWREWIRLHTPRAIADVMDFIEATTGAIYMMFASYKIMTSSNCSINCLSVL